MARGIGSVALLLIGLSTASSAVSAQDGPGDLLRAIEPVALAETMGAQSSQSSSESFVTRVGSVLLDSDVFLSGTSAVTGQTRASASRPAPVPSTFVVELFPGAQWVIEVSGERHPRPGVVALTGRVLGQDLATFSLTVTEESYLMTLDDPSSRYRYRLVGATDSGRGEVKELDRQLIGPVYHLPPRVPPVE